MEAFIFASKCASKISISVFRIFVLSDNAIGYCKKWSMGGRYQWADTSPTLTDCLFVVYAMVVR
jgi:hypothetical protein